MTRLRTWRGLALAALLAGGCGTGRDAPTAGAPHTYRLGTGEAVEIRLDPVNKSFGSSPPNSLPVAFTIEELKRFFAPGAVPVRPQLLAMLESEERTMHDGRECNAYAGDSPVSMVLRPSLDHAALQSMRDHDRSGRYEFEDKPRFLHGLRDLGRIDYSGTGQWLSGNTLRLAGPAPFGFEMFCGHLDSAAEGGCLVRRDLHARIEVHYSYCEDLLPHWREIDALYFEIARRIVSKPSLSPAYRLPAD
jgi:hypothetical protein